MPSLPRIYCMPDVHARLPRMAKIYSVNLHIAAVNESIYEGCDRPIITGDFSSKHLWRADQS